MKKVIWVFILGMVAASGAASADTRILKWVDKQGVTHYGDRPPSFEESKSNIEMNKQGMVTKKNAPAEQKNEVKDLQQQQQERKDKILLASYTNDNEIDLARDRSLEMNKAAMVSLALQKEGLTARIARNKVTTDGFKTRNKPLPANLDKEFKDAVTQSDRIDKQIADRKLEMEQNRKNYAEDKARYLVLRQPNAANDVASVKTPASSTAESPTAKKVIIEKLPIDKK